MIRTKDLFMELEQIPRDITEQLIDEQEQYYELIKSTK